MQSLGVYLRELRRAKGLTLEEIARQTRVPRRYLESLEAEDFDQLPAPIFTKGFIRCYCQSLDEPPDGALARYRELIGEAANPPSPAVLSRLPERRSRGPMLASLVLLIVLGLSLFILTVNLQGRWGEVPIAPSEPRRIAAPAPPAPVKSAEPVSVPEAMPYEELAGLVEPTPRVEPAPAVEPARLVARTSEPTWVRVQLDDGKVVEELLPAGATRQWTSEKRFVLTIGNAGGISLELNGEPLPPLGTSGEVIHNLVLPSETP
ncbi:MAG: helix-turn-helix domain-containing protein [Candidatus Methylomirabilia bacterium]